MKSRKRDKYRHSATQVEQTTPNDASEDVARAAIHRTSNCSEIYKQCDRRECRSGETCMAEGFVPRQIAHCARHWTRRDIEYFRGALDFGFIYLCPPGSRHPDLGDIDPENGTTKKSGDVVPIVFFVPRALIGKEISMDAVYNASLTTPPHFPCSPKVPVPEGSRPSATVQTKSRPASG
jgi:hypothetical protein